MKPRDAGPEPLPVAQSLFAPSGLRDLVAAEYDVGALTDCRLWVDGFSHTYLLATAGDRYALRLHRAGWRTDDEVAYELDAVRHLDRKGVSVAVPVRRADGAWFRSIRAPEGPRQLTLFVSAPGREAYREPGYAGRFGRAVAELHAAGADFRSAHQRFRIDLDTLLDRPLAHLEPRLAAHPDDWRYLVDLAGRLRRAVLALPAPALDWGLCHGDALGSNAHLDGAVATGRLTHFDFDDCGPGWRAYDLATFRWICAWKEADADTRWAEYLRGYRERRAVADLDLAAVPLFVAVREIWLAGQRARMAATRGQWLLDLRPGVRFLRDWEPHLTRG
jgi:Ser/Thr protein kinase RdoA (MazF antagonist)